MKKQPIWSLYTLLGLFLAAALLVFMSGSLTPGGLLRDPLQMWKKLIWPLIRLTGFISLGIFVGQIIERTGWADRFAIMARPFMGWAHIPEQMGAAFTTAFVSGPAALSMLATFHGEGKLSCREVILAVLLNNFPTFLRHLPTTFFVILSLVGKAGAVYLGLLMGAALFRLVAVLIYTRFALPPLEKRSSPPQPEGQDWQATVMGRGRELRRRLFQILPIVLPVYVIMVVASDMGLFLWLREVVAQGIANQFIPVEAMSVIIFSLAVESTSGYAAAGALMEAGSLSPVQAIIALLLGNMIATPIRALRHQIPYYVGMFPPRLGVSLIVISQVYRLVSLIGMGFVFVLAAGMVH